MVKLGNGNNGQRGITLVMTALVLLVLLIVAALAIDLGIAYTVRTSAQHAADAAALAGADAFQRHPDWTAADVDKIKEIARAAGQANRVFNQAITIPASAITVDFSKRRVTADLTGTNLNANVLRTFFARAMGWQTFDIHVTATAEAAPSATSTRCLKPFFIANTAMRTGTVSQACAGNSQVLIDPATRSETDFGKSKRGSQLPIWDKGSEAASHWGEIRLPTFGPGNSTGPTFVCTIKQCLNDCDVNDNISCGGEPLTAKPGGTVGSIATPVEELINMPNQDLFRAIGSYEHSVDGVGTGVFTDSSPSLVTVAVFDNCSFSLSPGLETQLPILGYAQIFVESITGTGSNKGITARLIDVSPCGAAPPPGHGSGAIPVRLVHPN